MTYNIKGAWRFRAVPLQLGPLGLREVYGIPQHGTPTIQEPLRVGKGDLPQIRLAVRAEGQPDVLALPQPAAAHAASVGDPKEGQVGHLRGSCYGGCGEGRGREGGGEDFGEFHKQMASLETRATSHLAPDLR